MCVRSQRRDGGAAETAGQSDTISGEDDHAAELHLCSHRHDGNILIIFVIYKPDAILLYLYRQYCAKLLGTCKEML